MADDKAPSVQESSEDTLQALYRNFPALMEAYNAQVVPTEQSKLSAAQVTSEPYQELLTNLYQKYAPQLASTASSINLKDRIANAEADAQILKTSGADLARTYKGIDSELNPEYYKTRADAGNKLGQLLASFEIDSPNVEAERLVNQENIRSGNATTPSATNTVANAISFGNERLKRQAALINAISTATQFLQPASNAQFNPATTILNRPTSNAGLSQFGGVNRAGSEAYSSGEGFLNNIASFQNNAMQINANRRDVLDRLNDSTPSISL